MQGPGQADGGPAARPRAVEQARAAIDSLYNEAGYYAAEVKVLRAAAAQREPSGWCSTSTEGSRVAISQVVVEGNKQFSDKAVVEQMATRPEGFWWFQKGEYDERQARRRTSASGCRGGTPTGASWTSRSPAIR